MFRALPKNTKHFPSIKNTPIRAFYDWNWNTQFTRVCPGQGMRKDVLHAFATGARRSRSAALQAMDQMLVNRIVSLASVLMGSQIDQLYLVFFGPREMRMRSKGTGASRGGGPAVDYELDVDAMLEANQRSFCMVNRDSTERVDFVVQNARGLEALDGLAFRDYVCAPILCSREKAWATERPLSPGEWLPAAKCGAGELGPFFKDKRMDYLICSLEQLQAICKKMNCEHANCGWFLNEQEDAFDLFDSNLDVHGVCTADPLHIARHGYKLGEYPDQMHGITVVERAVSFTYNQHGECTDVLCKGNAHKASCGVKTATCLRTGVDYLLPHGVAMILALKIDVAPTSGAQMSYLD